MARLLSLLAVCALAGCASSVSMVPEAEPYAPRTVEDVDGLVEYLEASGIEVVRAVSRQDFVRPRVVRSAYLDFGNKGSCTVLTYESAEDAEQIGPRSVQEGARDIRRPLPSAPTSLDLLRVQPRSGRRGGYNPTHRFGPLVASCWGTAPRRALQSLEEYARSAS